MKTLITMCALLIGVLSIEGSGYRPQLSMRMGDGTSAQNDFLRVSIPTFGELQGYRIELLILASEDLRTWKKSRHKVILYVDPLLGTYYHSKEFNTAGSSDEYLDDVFSVISFDTVNNRMEYGIRAALSYPPDFGQRRSKRFYKVEYKITVLE